MLGIIRICLVACVWIAFSARAFAGEVVCSFSGPQDGGLAIIAIDPASGTLSEPRVLVRDPSLRSIRKLAVWAGTDGERVIGAVVPRTPPGNVVLVWLAGEPGEPNGSARLLPVRENAAAPLAPVRVVDFPAEADEIRATHDGFLLGGDDGWLANVLLSRESVATRFAVPPPCMSRWSARAQLRPSGSKPEDIRVRPDGASAWITFQKDSKKGEHRGHRLVRLSLPDMSLLGDLQIDRSRQEHHPPGSPRDHGPSPEIVLEHAASNTLLVTLDNYGAVLLADLDAALEGRWGNAVQLSTAIDGTFGAAYPDRAVILPRRLAPRADDQREASGASPPASIGPFALVANAGPGGGAVLIDLEKRARVGAVPCRPGLDGLAAIGDGSLVVAAGAGKVKERRDDGASRRFEPAAELVVFDLADPSRFRAHAFTRPHPVPWTTVVDDAGLVLAVERDASHHADTLTLLRVGRGEDGAPTLKALGSVEAPGRVERVIALP